MQEWTVESPQVIDVADDVRSLAVRLVAGHVDVVTTDGPSARVEVTEVDDDPLVVSIDDDGRLVIRHARLTWGGILGWLRKCSSEHALDLAAWHATRPQQHRLLEAADDGGFDPDFDRPVVDHEIDAPAKISLHMGSSGRRDVARKVG